MIREDDTVGNPTSDRGMAPQVGFVLLAGLAILGAILLLVTGAAIFDTIGSNIDREQALQHMTQTDHVISTAAASSDAYPLPDSEASFSDDGSMTLVWYNQTIDGDPDWSTDGECYVHTRLGAIEYELEDRTLAHQGGGIWERTGDATTVYSAPNVGYEEGSLRLDVVTLEEAQVTGTDPVARANHSEAEALSGAVRTAARNCPDGTDVALRIESTYHEGWNQFLEDELGEHADEVIHRPAEEAVEVRLVAVRAPFDPATFIVRSDRGLIDSNGEPIDPPVLDERMSDLRIGGVIENVGEREATQTVAVSIWHTSPDHEIASAETELTLEAGQRRDVSEPGLGGPNGQSHIHFPPGQLDLEPGNTYSYTISTEDDETDVPGSFYYGKPGTVFELFDPEATVEETVQLSVELQNVGVEDGSQDVGLTLEYKDELPPGVDDPYGYLGSKTVNRSFGERGTVGFELNASVLLDGEYEVTIHTEDDSVSVPFTVTVGVDPGEVGLEGIEDANVTVEVLGSQVSSAQGHLAPMTLDVVTNGETEHSFENPLGGNNINIGPTWQDKSDDSYTYEFTVEDETELTLRNARYGICWDEATSGNELPHYSGSDEFRWCNDVRGPVEFGPIDASQGQNLQNVRVRSAEDNEIPALPAGTDHQLSATEVLEQRGLIAEEADELDLGPGEFVFLIENTAATSEEGIDALWDEAIDAYERHPHQTHDPNFNDLIVYVHVERAGVTPDTPSITISPGGGESPDVGSGESDGADGSDGSGEDIGLDLDTDHIIIG